MEGVPALSPACPAFSFVSCPHPPRPPSRREGGGIKVISCKGLRPLHPRGLNLRFAAKPTEKFPYGQCRQPRRGGTGGEELRRLRWSSPPGQVEPVPPGAHPPPGTAAAGLAGAAWVQPWGCKGRSPLHKKTKSLPLPAGKSALRARVGGMGVKRTLKAWQAGDKAGTPPSGHHSGRNSQCRLGCSPHPPNTPCPTNGNLKKILQCIKSLDLTSRVWYNNGGSVSETILIL